MKTLFDTIQENIRLDEGPHAIEQMVISCYLKPGIATKELARHTMLPVPLATAVKKELIRAGLLRQERGVRCTPAGNAWVEQELDYDGLDIALYHALLEDGAAWRTLLADWRKDLSGIYDARPQADVQIDQSKCTMETSLKRAVLCLREHALIGKRVLCIGDDDLVSISLGLLLKRLFPGKSGRRTRIHVVDIDERFLQYIHDVAEREQLPVLCHHADLRQPLPETLHGRFDCFFTDPPYTLQGMSLFLSRGISALKKSQGLPIFLSFAHKPPGFTLAMQQEFIRMGLMVQEMIPHFNEYEGAQMIGGRGQMIVLKSTERTVPGGDERCEGAIYTGEIRRTERLYRCKQCLVAVRVGQDLEIGTIEQLKQRGCPRCGGVTFELVEKKQSGKTEESPPLAARQREHG